MLQMISLIEFAFSGYMFCKSVEYMDYPMYSNTYRTAGIVLMVLSIGGFALEMCV